MLKAVAGDADVAAVKDLLWKDLESAHSDIGLDRHDPTTWQRWKLPSHGIDGSLAQSAGAWHLRGLPRVQAAFKELWGVEDIITSMDATILWKPWMRGARVPPWRPRSMREGQTATPAMFLPPLISEGLHLDQNPFSKPDLECVQGMVPLLPVTEVSGGLQVVPRSHTAEGKARLLKAHPLLEDSWGGEDWCPLPPSSRFNAAKISGGRGAVLLEAEAGDLILWDSRLVHGGKVGLGTPQAAAPTASTTNADPATPNLDAGLPVVVAPPPAAAAPTALNQAPPPVNAVMPLRELARMTVTVAMTPRAWACEDVQRQRRAGFEAGRAFNHVPHEAGTSSGTVHATRKSGYLPFELTAEQNAVL